MAGLGLGIMLLGGLIAAHWGGGDIAWAEAMLRRIRDAGPLGWLGFTAVQIVVAMAGIVPASLLGMMAGMTYGVGLGFALSTVGTLVGGWLAFMLARSLLRDWVAARLPGASRQAQLDAAIARDGWRMVCLLRISPIMPFAVTSYALGLTGISLRAYLLGTLAALPALLGYVIVGALTGMGVAAGSSREASVVRLILLGIGIAATLLLTLRLGRLLQTAGLLASKVAPATLRGEADGGDPSMP